MKKTEIAVEKRKPGRPRKNPVVENPVPKKRGRPFNATKQAMLAELSRIGSKDNRPRRRNKDGEHTRRRSPDGKPIIVKEYVRQNGVTRPWPTWNDGTPKVTYQVWEICDKLSAELGRPCETREALRKLSEFNAEAPDSLKVTFGVFNSEFYRWRKFNGIRGRRTKGGKRVASSGNEPKVSDTKQTEFAFTPAPVKPPPPKKPVPPAFLNKPPTPKKPALPWAT